ncbi:MULTISPECIES: aromatic ring-hydroxylating oxygenase subunit alpha [Nostocales]|uniref:Aromatic ring-hydroxylating dioxygenase subunit alpha n=3 Tax=Nostocales TaxID=1161 RepID=A0A0C1RI27_9CYAN|nr:aromatic ring-hydroxylating dioxygenase subunit alpha [Tolypothrix bouteillei]KAF3887519.1 aromatic ring-hydroxylating dioxygenase subunit alpha [Tolypothrix bouteillei VB521301]
MENFLFKNWYIVCTSRELGQKPIGRTVLGIPLAIFRGLDGKPSALLDKCPHRNVPLSKGWVKNNYLICKYHGWCFDEQGVCREVPGLCDRNEVRYRNAVAYPAIEQDGFIWVYCQADERPQSQPYEFPCLRQKEFSTFSSQMECETTLENAAENFLDATHTHFVHSGLIRTDNQRKEITVQITRSENMVEAIYLNEENISGLIYKLLAPGCHKVIPIGRFILPSIAQLEYRTDSDRNRLFISLFLTPIKENLTKAYSIVTFRSWLPSCLGRIIAQPLFARAARQDKEILQLQNWNINRFQGESFVLTELDVIRPHILYLLKQGCERNGSSLFEKTITMRI